MLRAMKLGQQIKYILIIGRSMYVKTPFNQTHQRISFPEDEEHTLQFWQQKKCFEEQLKKTKHLPPYTFYDGPPFATGTPHYGHICAGTIKDVICRYAAQTGHYVERRFGWDCHGLPIQYQIDKEYNIKDRKQILEMGIAEYNRRCRSIVMKYSGEWRTVVNRFGRWIDFDNDYKTLDLTFMESVWYVFKVLFNKGLVYRGRKIMPYSNAVSTVLSNFQTQLNYKEVDDPSLYINFPLVSDPKVKFVVWTTTPWTLPSNLALAVNPNFEYVKVKDLAKDQIYILAQCRLKDFYKTDKKKEKQFQILEKMKGTDLENLQYVPLFNFFLERAKDGCFRVQTADFVSSDAGTGIVHCAPGFGDDDYKMCVKKKIIHPDKPVVPVDENGRFTNEVPPYKGVYLKDADKIIIKDLKEQGRVVRVQTLKHNYPFCWRSDTPLIYKAVSTWFIKVTDIKDDLVKNNFKATWVPKNIQEGRFDNWLKDAQDWCFSRNRFWGNPIPLWVSDDGEQIVCVGSLKELTELTGQTVTDLHRESIDHLTIESKQGKGKLKRIQQVFDCWFESGSMPFAQVHYPFSTSEQKFKSLFPADFIGEGIDQTRGWFYTLNVISTGVLNMNPYKNLIVNGLVLTEEGKKMSKRLKNYPDPMDVCNQFGADAVRLYLINSPLVRADNLNFSKQGVKSVVKQIFLPWYNAYRFLIQNISKYQTRTENTFIFVQDLSSLSNKFTVLDSWIQSSLQVLIQNVRKEMGEYKLYAVVPQLVRFLQLLTNWYVRLNRQRLKGQSCAQSMFVSLNVLFDVLLKTNILMSPHVPFITQNMYQNMRMVIKQGSPLKQESIHYLLIPNADESMFDAEIERKMASVREIIQVGRKLRQNKQISLKQPIISLSLVNSDLKVFEELKPFLEYVEDQLNVAEVHQELNVDKFIKLQALPNLPILGPKFKGDKTFGQLKQAINNLTTQQIRECKSVGSIELVGKKIQYGDLLVKQKFINDSLKAEEVIGGDKLIVLLDTRQNEELKIRGFAREIINRIQKLKKKAHLSPNDEVLIFYRFPVGSKYLNTAIEKEWKSIEAAVKRPLSVANFVEKRVMIGQDKGLIDDEQYEVIITYPGPIFDQTAMNNSYLESTNVLVSMVLSLPLKLQQGKNEFKLKLDGKDCPLELGKHYKYL